MIVVYSTPTYVHIEDGQIAKVSVADDAPELADLDRQCAINPGVPLKDVLLAMAAAEDEGQDWPAWDFG